MTEPPDLEASFASNQRLRDAWTKVHAEGRVYDLAGFRQGGIRVRPYEIAAIGDVEGKSLLPAMPLRPRHAVVGASPEGPGELPLMFSLLASKPA